MQRLGGRSVGAENSMTVRAAVRALRIRTSREDETGTFSAQEGLSAEAAPANVVRRHCCRPNAARGARRRHRTATANAHHVGTAKHRFSAPGGTFLMGSDEDAIKKRREPVAPVSVEGYGSPRTR